jgi:hypothetical protein
MKLPNSIFTLLCLVSLMSPAAQRRFAMGAGSCVPEVAIQTINGQAVNTSPSSMPGVTGATIDGKMTGCMTSPGEITVGVLVNRVFDGTWYAAGRGNTESTEIGRGSKEAHWRVRDVSFQMPDIGKGFKIYAFVLPKTAVPFPTGAVDYAAVHRLALSISEPIEVVLSDDPSGNGVEGTCKIELTEIRSVDGQLVSVANSQKAPIDVEVDSDMRGYFDRPNSTHYIYLSVLPVDAEARWIMPRRGSAVGTVWTEAAYFGRRNIDVGESFRVQAFISKAEISPGSYPLSGWSRFEPQICAYSKEVLVKRRIAAGDLVIRKVDERDVTRTPMDVDFDFPVEGRVEEARPDTAILAGETVWILARRARSDEGWVVKALAVVSTDGYSFKANVHFSQPGQYILMALASTRKLAANQVLAEQSWYQAANVRAFRRLSRTVEVAIKHE